MPKLLFADGLTQYADATDMQRRFLTATGALTSYTRTSGATAKEAACDGNGPEVAVNPSTPTQGTVGARFILAAWQAYTGLFSISDATVMHLTAFANIDGSIAVNRGDHVTGTLLGTSPAGVLTLNQRYYIEMKFTISNTVGTIEIRVNEVVVLTLTGLDTQNGGTAAWTKVRQYNYVGAGSYKIGDIHIHDATGGHGYGGDLQTDPHYPTGAGNSTGGTPSAGANWQCVDDNPSNGNTDYVSMTAAATKDTYAYQNLIATGTAIKAVTPVLDALKVDAGTATLATVTRRGGTDYPSADLAPSAGSYRYLSDLPMETDPATAAAWTEANFNAAEFGFEKTA